MIMEKQKSHRVPNPMLDNLGLILKIIDSNIEMAENAITLIETDMKDDRGYWECRRQWNAVADATLGHPYHPIAQRMIDHNNNGIDIDLANTRIVAAQKKIQKALKIFRNELEPAMREIIEESKRHRHLRNKLIRKSDEMVLRCVSLLVDIKQSLEESQKIHDMQDVQHAKALQASEELFEHIRGTTWQEPLLIGARYCREAMAVEKNSQMHEKMINGYRIQLETLEVFERNGKVAA